MEMKYGKSFKLENGEYEYIEISGEYDASYQMDNKMNYLKSKVNGYHHEAETYSNAWRELPQKSDSNGLATWERALLLVVCTIYVIILHICPMWLKGLIVSLTILWTIYCYVKEEKNGYRKSSTDSETAQRMEEGGRYTDGESY